VVWQRVSAASREEEAFLLTAMREGGASFRSYPS
jgi:hypothetical protein